MFLVLHASLVYIIPRTTTLFCANHALWDFLWDLWDQICSLARTFTLCNCLFYFILFI